MKRSLASIAMAVVVMGLSPLAPGQTVIVPGDFSTIQDAINAIDGGLAADTILVLPGTYGPIAIDGLNITVKSTGGAASTTIDGGGTLRAALLENANPTIDGFTITGGSAPAGAGVLLASSDAIIRNCIIESNGASFLGGGLSIADGAPTIIGSVFRLNSSGIDGGAVWMTNASPTFVSCVFQSNTADGHGGAIHVNGGSTPQIVNCTFHDNAADADGDNDGEGGAMAIVDTSDAVIANSILRENVGDTVNEIFVEGGSSATVSFSNVEGGFAGVDNIDADPDFAGDLSLNTGSPSIDAGSNDALFAAGVGVATDAHGQPRVRNGGGGCEVDMGAFEYVPQLGDLVDSPNINVIASTDAAFESIGTALINAAGDRIVFSADAGDARLFLWDANIAAFDPADTIPAVDAHITDLSAGGEVHIGGVTMQRNGLHIAYITQVDQNVPQLWILDLTDPTDATETPTEVNIGALGATFTMLGQLSIDDEAAPQVSFWKLTCDGADCTHHIMESDAADPTANPATEIAASAAGEAVFAPVRALDGSRTLFLQFQGDELSLRSDDAVQPLVYEASSDNNEVGMISAVTTNDAGTPRVAAFVSDPVAAAPVDPGIYVFDLGVALNVAADLDVNLDGVGEAVATTGVFLVPNANVRPALNQQNDLAFAALDVTNDLHLETVFTKGAGLTPVVTQCSDVIEAAEVQGGIEVLGISDEDGGNIRVLFRADVAVGGDTWTVLASMTTASPLFGSDVPGPTCPADLNGDGVVGVADLLALLGAWGPCANPLDCPADLTGTATVGVADLLVLLSAWGSCP